MNRGSSEVDIVQRPRVSASMRPRFMNRGSNAAFKTITSWDVELQ